MLIQVNTATLYGIDAIPIKVEVDTYPARTIQKFTIVGLPDSAVKESYERICASLRSHGYSVMLQNIVINLAPADIRKEGSAFDLPITIGVFASLGLLRVPQRRLREYMFAGELGLDGTILPIKGALPMAIKARSMGMKALFVPKVNEREAAVVNNLNVYGVSCLDELLAVLSGREVKEPVVVNTRQEFAEAQDVYDYDFDEVKGQEHVKRALEIAAAGGHNVILIGSPGCGKSMMAKRLPSILPPLSLRESLETTQIHSIAGKLHKDTSLIKQRPFRAPHHTISNVALIGGGNTFMPGEICMAHNGILFLDELPEFSRGVLETLRQPLEDRVVSISRVKYSFDLPCSFMFVASMNPCPCGYHHHPTHTCYCTPGQIQRYMNKISGPLLDRIDLHVVVEAIDVDKLTNQPKGESSAQIRARVIKAREIQLARFTECEGVHCNAQMTSALMQKYASLSDECSTLLRDAMRKMNLSARAYDKIIKVARTIADLDGKDEIQKQHIAEAFAYRSMDRACWYE